VDIRNLLNERKKVCEEEKRFVQVFIREYWRENEDDYTVIGPRTYFRMPTQIYDPSHLFLPKARELSIGMSNIIHQTLKHEYPMGLNLNWCITPIIAGQTLMDFLAKYFANGIFSKIDEHRKSMVINNSYNSCWKFWDTMKIALQSGIKVRAKHGNRLKYVTVGYVLVDRWHAESGYHTADTYMFECKGKWITATQYYNETYPEHPLKYPFLPMVHVMKPKKEGPTADAANAANGTTDGKDKQKADGKDKQKTDGKEKKENDILIPMELLEVLPVRLENSEMDPEDIKKCLRKAAVSAYERFDKIKVLEDVLRDTLFKRLDEVLGLSVTVKRQVKPIQMTPVKVKTGTDLSYTREFNPRVFSNMAGSGMKRGLKWGLYFVCPNDWVRDSQEASVVNIKKEFLRECARKEIHLDPEPVFTKFIRDDMEEEKNKTDANKEAIRQTVRDVMAEAASSNPDLVLFLSKGKAKPFYQLIKVETELNSDVTWCSQFCIMVEGKKDDKHKWSMAGTSKKFPQMCAKVHSKIQGGLYYDIKFHDCLKDAVVIGADVIHERGHDNPSIAGVVASCRSMGYVNYFSEIRIQESKDQANKTRLREAEEKIVDLYDMLVTLFARIKDTAELKKPKSVFFCRDGVADCQMEMVREFEGKQIRAAFKEVFGFVIPALNIVVGQKRHKVRFLDNSMEDGNVPPGTLIDDSAIIRGSPTHMDFYLVAHKAIQGTSRPCHYHVIENESKLQPSDYHTVCYQLSHCLPTSAAIISYSAPAAVADRLCERGKIYVNDVFNRPENRRKPPAEKFALAREKLLEFSNAHTQGKVFFS
jgi:eukaryotic translation initiation factor 2C